VNHRTDAVNTDCIAASSVEDVIPPLLAFLLRPGVGALIDRDDQLIDVSQDLEELGLCGFHQYLIKL
jgi:hypothetical protein